MTLNQLKYAIVVSESESFNIAAKKLYISQPSLSTSIHALEEEVGIQIFRRSQNGIAVTPDGKEFLGYARQVMEQFELLDARYISKSDVKKKFSVSMQHYTFAVNAFVELVRQYGMDEYEFAVHETKTHEVIEDVRNGKSEIGILYLNDFNRKVLEKIFAESAIEFHPLLECNVYVYMSNTHPLAKKESISLEELKDYPCLSFDQGEYNSFYYAEEFLSMLDMPKNIQVRDRATMFNLIIGLNGFTVCSGVISEELNGSQIIARPLAMDVQMRIGLVKKKNILFSRYADTYIEALKKYVSIG